MTNTTAPRPYQQCTRCLMDTSDPAITFDNEGICNHCTRYFNRVRDEVHRGPAGESALARIVDQIRAEGRGKEYDCIAGVSGGVDSTFVVYKLKQLGLRPLAVHFDNGWNSEVAVANIKKTLDKLDIDLYTYVVDWEEFKDLQMSFIKASVPNCEIPTDHAITATLVSTAKKHGIRYVINGSNVVTEGILPISWVYYSHDLRHIKALHRRHGTVPLRSFPRISLPSFTLRILSGRYKMVNLLNFVDYDKSAAMQTMQDELGWQYYGGKHYESIYTRWYQGYYLPTKFGFDKRRAHLSALVCAGQMTREEGLEQLTFDPYAENDLQGDTDFVLKKFGITADDLQRFIDAPNRAHTDYPNQRYFIEELATLKNFVRRTAKSV
ncbi:ExsB family protein [Achromobacter denitrificans]|uniref:N-acetyl sugar amidotransferase n=1 Tax=Achromobacter denitrificans TaxID=32002 RepID=UPI000B4D740E|nr:N-acetyl sugar amidotransferase [Achromobacter denitrificans]ASC64860.1 ExsB family protein [Achromobacter denitrificans]